MYGKMRCLNGNVLKIIAAVCMVIDHVGLMFFPGEMIYRIIGRIAFPIFAFMISEGARYTKSKLRYFLTMFGLGFVCQVVYFVFDYGNLDMCILITFSISIALIYVLQFVKAGIFSSGSSILVKIIYVAVGLLAVWGVLIINSFLSVDYGVYGCLLPAFASLLDFRGIEIPDWLKKLDIDNLPFRILTFTIGLTLLSNASGTLQYFSLFAIPLLLLYSEKRGRLKMKYFFYLFYPLHLVVLEGIYVLIHIL